VSDEKSSLCRRSLPGDSKKYWYQDFFLLAFFTRGRPQLAALQVAALVYGVIVEIFGFWCPSRRWKSGLRCVVTFRPNGGPFPSPPTSNGAPEPSLDF
jgi:hypothetical protein